MKGTPEVVIFDLDGTLVPTMDVFADIAADVLAQRHGWSAERARAAYFETSGVPFADQLEVLFPGDPTNALVARDFERRKRRRFYAVPIERDVLAALRTLRNAGMRLVVSSNNYEHLVHGKIRHEAPELFDIVLGHRGDFRKGPRHFAVIFERLETAPNRCLFVGDSLTDLVRAREAEIDFVGVLGTFERRRFVEADPAARTIDSVARIPDLLGIAPLEAAGGP